jgi:hypothetical protein
MQCGGMTRARQHQNPALTLLMQAAESLTLRDPPSTGGGPPIVFLKVALARMLAVVIGLCLREIALGVLHKVGLGLFAAEAVGLALNDRVD